MKKTILLIGLLLLSGCASANIIQGCFVNYRNSPIDAYDWSYLIFSNNKVIHINNNMEVFMWGYKLENNNLTFIQEDINVTFPYKFEGNNFYLMGALYQKC